MHPRCRGSIVWWCALSWCNAARYGVSRETEFYVVVSAISVYYLPLPLAVSSKRLFVLEELSGVGAGVVCVPLFCVLFPLTSGEPSSGRNPG